MKKGKWIMHLNWEAPKKAETLTGREGDAGCRVQNWGFYGLEQINLYESPSAGGGVYPPSYSPRPSPSCQPCHFYRPSHLLRRRLPLRPPPRQSPRALRASAHWQALELWPQPHSRRSLQSNSKLQPVNPQLARPSSCASRTVSRIKPNNQIFI